MKKMSHLGAYGLIVKDNKIVLIKKANGPYKGKLDLPGGTIEYGETPEKAVVRELQEEVGIDVRELSLVDANSVLIEWMHHEELEQIHHIGIFYKIIVYRNEIKNVVEITEQNDDSLGASFYEINQLSKEELSEIAIIAIEKLGYNLK